MTDLVSQLVGALELCQRALQSQWSPYLRAGDKEAAAMKAAASALTAAKAGGWLPIETAPKDARRVLVWIDDKHLARERRQIHFAKLWFYEDGRLGGGAEGFNGDWNITHWQPLPNPPKEQA